MRILVTGGAGFIGSAVVLHLLGAGAAEVLTFDALTYAGSLASLKAVKDLGRHRFAHGDLRCADAIEGVGGSSGPT